MKIKNAGFTLIELLVVIVIIGILSTISTATFKSYFGKARDAERRAAVQNLALMIKVDSSDRWDDTKYIYDKAGLEKLASSNDFRFPRASKNICYFIATSTGADAYVGDDNQFVVAVWGETGASAVGTQDTGAAGLIIDGTEEAVNALANITTPLTEAGFACGTVGTTSGTPMTAFTDAFSSSSSTSPSAGGTQDYFIIDVSGNVVDGA